MMSYFNAEQLDSMKTPEERAEEKETLARLTETLMGKARERGPLTPEDETELLARLLEVRGAGDVTSLARRALIELRSLRKTRDCHDQLFEFGVASKRRGHCTCDGEPDDEEI